MEIEIGKGKMARRAYGFDEVAIVPSRRTRDPDDVDISWQIDAYTFGLPMMASAMDAGVSPATAVRIGQLGGLACLNLEGLWTRYEDPEPIYEEIAALPDPVGGVIARWTRPNGLAIERVRVPLGVVGIVYEIGRAHV